MLPNAIFHLWQQAQREAEQAQRGRPNPLAQLTQELQSQEKSLKAPLNLDEWCPKLQAGDKDAAEKTGFLASRELTASEISRICQAARDNPHVTVMNFYKSPLTDDGVTAIVQFMSQTRSLTHLDVAHTGISPHGALKLCFMLKSCPSLQVVNMFGLRIGPAAAACLADALRERNALKYLNLWQANIGDGEVNKILDGLTAFPRPFYLALDRGKLSPEVIRRLSNTPQLTWNDNYKESSELFAELEDMSGQLLSTMRYLTGPLFGN